MKKKYSFRGIMLCLFLLNAIISSSQSTGDIAFIAFNTDGNKDFAIVALADITPDTTIYFTDDETNGSGGFIGTEGIITWSSGTKTITAGTIVIFTDIDNTNLYFGSSIGTISRNGAFGLANKDGIIAYTGTDEFTPTTYLAAIQIGNKSSQLGPFDPDDITLTATGLTVGTTITVINNVASPTGGKYDSSRSNQTLFSNYLTSISDKNKWTTTASSGDGETLLPFSQEAFTTSSTIWNGTSDDWNTAGNWNNGVPTIHSNVSIPNTSNNPKIKSGTIALAGNITIDPGASLEVTQNLTAKGLTTINSSSSNSGTFKVTGTYTGSLVYNRNIPHALNSWYLISSPVQNYRVVDFATQNPIQLGSGTGTSQNIALAKFDNGQALANDRWSYYTVGDIDHDNDRYADTTDELTTGQGFSTSLSTADDITFEGTLQTADVTRTITIGASGVGTNFNLVGNPYPAYLNSNTFMTNNSNITTTIWVWNQSLPDYETKNLASEFKLAPGQGFFIEANSGASVLFEKSSLSHEITNTFQKSANPYIKFTINSEGIKRYAEVYYLNNATKGFDNGYDGKLFGGVSHPFAVYTHLVSDNKGEKFQIQSLPNSEYENMVIPIGVNAAAGKEITFTTEVLNVPADINVFLEDRLTNTFTRLDETNSEYKVTLSETLNGVGRFYMHTTQSVLSTDAVILNSVQIYKTGVSTLKITGLPQGKTSFYLYNILGKEMMTTLFTSSGNKEISLSKLASGIYVAKMQTEKGAISKKIILE